MPETIYDTIIAECTAPYKAALAVIRMSGKDAFAVLGHMIEGDVSTLKPRVSYYRGLYKDSRDHTSLIDRSLVVLFKGKESFSGEDSVEFYVHGSRIIVEELLETAVKWGARRAQGGEFSLKAYCNGKMDLTEAEAVNQLINARTKKAKDFALNSLSGKASAEIKEMKNSLDMLTAEIEVDIDYPEFDQEADLIKKAENVINPLLKQAEKLMDSSKQSKYLFNGVKVSIIGEPNVGKSTLLNKILGQEKAIVTPIPGTTRDVVEGEKEIGGIVYKFFDTAGIRKQADEIEEIGIKKSYEAAQESDVVLLLYEKGETAQKEIEMLGIQDILKSKPCIYVSTKRDLHGENANADISISKDDESLEKLFKLLQQKLDISDNEETGLSSDRDLDILGRFIETLKSAKEDISNQMTIDIVEIKMVEAVKCLDEMLGIDSPMEDIYDAIFKHFCIGK
jgi:tRNA modification GTPase